MPVKTLADFGVNAHAYALTWNLHWARLPLRDRSACVPYVDPATPEDTMGCAAARWALIHGYRLVRFPSAESYLMPPHHWLFSPLARFGSYMWSIFWMDARVHDTLIGQTVIEHSEARGNTRLVYVNDENDRPSVRFIAADSWVLNEHHEVSRRIVSQLKISSSAGCTTKATALTARSGGIRGRLCGTVAAASGPASAQVGCV